MSEAPNNGHPVHTIHKHLFLVRQDACEVGALQATLSLRSVPCAAVSKVLVALPLELVPTVVTGLRVWEETRPTFSELIHVVRTWLLSP